MRVTQSMIAQNSLRHLSQSYEKMQTYQNQLSTGKKISRASEDPVVAMNGMKYRTQVTETEQFKRNISEVYNWMDTADATLDETTNALHRVRELTIQASNDTYEESQRANIAQEVIQLREHLESLANTKANNKFIFNGTDTTNPPVNPEGLDVGVNMLAVSNAEDHEITFKGQTFHFEDDDPDMVFASESGETITITDLAGEDQRINYTYENDNGEERVDVLQERQVSVSEKSAVSTNGQDVEIELLKGVKVPVNTRAENIFSNELFGDLKALEKALKDPNTKATELSGMIDVIDYHINNTVDERAELGARYNRIEMIDDRVQMQEVIAKRIMSDNEDAEIERVITELMSQENVHRAALSSTGRMIQPTLMDFLR